MSLHRPIPVAVAALVACGVLVAGASAQVGRPAGSPDLAAMALALSDLPRGSRIDEQGYVRDPDFVASYERDFDVRGGRAGRSRLLAAFESLNVERTPADAKLTFDVTVALVRSKRGQQLLRSALASEGIPASAITIGKIRRPAIGQAAFVLPIRLRGGGLRFEFTILAFRYDRLLSSIGLIGVPAGRLYAADVDRLGRVAFARVRAGLVPANVAAPLLSGTLQPGQTLAATPGTWTGDELTFAYSWERCDAAGAGCVDVPGATAPTYAVGTGDLASTLRVRVTGRNRLGAVAVTSPASAVVSGPPGAPTSTAPPTISGTAQVGSQLTASTGSWSGEPTGLAYQWRRCDATGGACADLPGATAPEYVVATADSRSTLRVLVVATNAAGPGGAISAPSAVVP